MNGLCEITPSGGDTFDVRLDPGHAIFSGHFPGRPILPGVCTLAIVRRCASMAAGAPLRYIAVRESKFLAAITPTDRLTVRLRIMGEGASYKADATVTAARTVMLKLKATLAPDE